MTQTTALPTMNIRGIEYVVIGEAKGSQFGTERLYAVRRPKGSKVYAARRLPDHPLYCENRGYIVCNLGYDSVAHDARVSVA